MVSLSERVIVRPVVADDVRQNIGTINHLLRQLSDRASGLIATEETIKQMLSLPHVPHVYVVGAWRQGVLVGMASLFLRQTMLGWRGEVDDVVVDKAYRKEGIGEKLMRELLKIASQSADERKMPIKLALTCKPTREGGHPLYIKVGFRVVAMGETYLYQQSVGDQLLEI